MSIKKKRVILRERPGRFTARRTVKYKFRKTLKIKRVYRKRIRQKRKFRKTLKIKRVYRKRIRQKRVVRRVVKKKKRVVRRVVKKKKRVLARTRTCKVTRSVRRKDKQKLAPKKKRRQIVRVTERRKFSTRLDFSVTATADEKLAYIIKKVRDGMILRFVIRAPRGKGSPRKRAKKTGKVIRRSPYISTGWINFGTLSVDRIEFYLKELTSGDIGRIVHLFYMPKR